MSTKSWLRRRPPTSQTRAMGAFSPYAKCVVGTDLNAPAASVSLGDGSPVQDLLTSDAVKYGAGAALVYHGYKRTGSVLWALLYGLAGKTYPIVAVPVALAQGFATRKGCP